MKKLLYILPVLALLFQYCGSGENKKTSENNEISQQTGNITINGSEVLYPLALKWKEEFNKQYPNISVDIKATCSDNSLKQLQAGKINIAMSSRMLTQQEINGGLYAVPVAMDAVLPIINFNNPFIQTIVMKGITKQKLAGIYNGSIKTWGQLLGNNSKDAIEAYILPDSSGTSHTWAQLLHMDTKKLTGTCLFNNQSVVNTIVGKSNVIGYCSTSKIFNINTGVRNPELYVVPIDLNANGQADDNELVFDNAEMLKTAIGSGKYPSPPVRTLYFVTKNKPDDAAMKAFITWVLDIGQNFSAYAGLVNINNKLAGKFVTELK